MKREYITSSIKETQKIAKEFAKECAKLSFEHQAIVVGLRGELGGGKTTFIKALAKALGVKEKILSPTFVILKKFYIDKPAPAPRKPTPTPRGGRPAGRRWRNFYHIDCYRLQKPKELLDLGFKEIISDPKNIVVVEWADRVKKILPKETIFLKFNFVNIKEREILWIKND